MTPERLAEIKAIAVSAKATGVWPSHLVSEIVPDLIAALEAERARTKSLTDTFQDQLVVNNANRTRIAKLEAALIWIVEYNNAVPPSSIFHRGIAEEAKVLANVARAALKGGE